METESVRLKALFALSTLCVLLIAGWILWRDSPQPSGVVALLATVPFAVVARYAWNRMRRQEKAQ